MVKLKRIATIIMAFVFIFGTIGMNPITANAQQPITVRIDGQPVVFADQQPIIIDGRTLVPVRGVFEQLGFTVDWDGDNQRVTLTGEQHEVILQIGSAHFFTNGQQHQLDVPAQSIGGRTMLPIAAVVRSVGHTVDWDGSQNAVLIETGVTTTFLAPPEATPPVAPVTPEPPVVQEPEQPQGLVDREGELEAFRLLNEHRIANGVPELVWSDILAAAARAHSQDMSDNDFQSHLGSDGLAPDSRIAAAGGRYRYTAPSENIAWGFTAPLRTVNQWKNSPEHNRNQLDEGHTHVGIGHVNGHWTVKFAQLQPGAAQ